MEQATSKSLDSNILEMEFVWLAYNIKNGPGEEVTYLKKFK